MTATRSYNSSLRRDQAQATRLRIVAAVAALIEEGGGQAPTTKAIAERAQVTEVTVYRHFPRREALLKVAWEHLRERGGVMIATPSSPGELLSRIGPFLAAFDAAPAQVIARLASPQARQAGIDLHAEQREAFLNIVRQAAPDLAEAERVKAAAVLQLLYSAQAWLSLRDHWGLTGAPGSEALGWALKVLLIDLKIRGGEPLAGGARR